MEHPLRSRAPTADRRRKKQVYAAAFLVVAAWAAAGLPLSGARIAAAQRGLEPPEKQDGRYNTSLVPMQASFLDRSVAELVASGWQVVGVTVSGRIFQYHLIGEGSLAVCFVDTAGAAPGSECVRLASVPR